MVIGNNKEEYIQYPDYQWKHVIKRPNQNKHILVQILYLRHIHPDGKK